MLGRKVKAGAPWYKYPLVWFLIFVPAMTLVGSAFTLYYAISSTQSPVIDTYYKTGLKANALAEKEGKAAELGLEADVIFSDDNKVEARVNKPIDEESLVLIMQHPTLAEHDVEVPLARQAVADGKTLFVGELPQLVNAEHWYLRLESKQNHWRVLGAKSNKKVG